jgi:hypothetical protein
MKRYNVVMNLLLLMGLASYLPWEGHISPVRRFMEQVYQCNWEFERSV